MDLIFAATWPAFVLTNLLFMGARLLNKGFLTRGTRLFSEKAITSKEMTAVALVALVVGLFLGLSSTIFNGWVAIHVLRAPEGLGTSEILLVLAAVAMVFSGFRIHSKK